MISIIVSSYLSDFFNQIESNIKRTCGVEYELIKVNNPGKISITQAYNLGGKKAKFPYLLFIHEDTLIHSSNWGMKLIKHLDHKDTGIIGVAGSSYLVKVPFSWYMIDCDFVHTNFIQNSREGDKPSRRNMNVSQLRTRVYKLDGMFLAMKKEVFDRFKFNENLIGYHGYDTDISLRVSEFYDNYVINDIIIEHFSAGKFSKEWVKSHQYIKKYVKYPLLHNTQKEIEIEMFLLYLKICFSIYDNYLKSLIHSFRYLPTCFNLKIIKTYIKFIPLVIFIRKKIY